MDIRFDNSFARLPEYFHTKTQPSRVNQAELIIYNHELAKELGISNRGDDDNKLAEIFSGNLIPTGAEPISTVYAGHQFGGFSPQLGDGRAILLGEILGADDQHYDLQLKGSGPTVYSRSGDGRSALGPVLREYLVSEAMAKMGVPTSRALAAVTTGEDVARNTLVAGGIITRVSKGFVRVGSFEYFSSQKNQTAIKQLADYEIDRHYPEAKKAENPYISFLEAVINNQAMLIARWMQLGFIHGVMNTDNVSIAGETIDYGPCAFMDSFSKSQVYSSIDSNGRYAYNNQPQIGQWNLLRLAESLLPFLADEKEDGKVAVSIAQDVLNAYADKYKAYWLAGMKSKVGLTDTHDKDESLIEELLDLMEESKADFTLTFFNLSLLGEVSSEPDDQFKALFSAPENVASWLGKWRKRLSRESSNHDDKQALMRSVNPVYIPRNHQVERAIRAAEDNNDFSVFQELHEVLQNPFKVQEGRDEYMLPPKPEQIVHQTFCGT